MNAQDLGAAGTVIQLDDYLQKLKRQALSMCDGARATSRGYITPSKELQIRQLQLSYWKTRNALLELIQEIRGEAGALDRATPAQFLTALAAAALLIDAARTLRESFHRAAVIRRKLDEADPIYGIPPRMYDDVQRSLVSARNAWHLWQAARYYDAHRRRLAEVADAEGLLPLVTIIDRLRARLRPSLWLYLRTRLRVRGRRALRRVGRDMLGRDVYAAQQSVSELMSDISLKPGHRPGLPPAIRAEVVGLVQPGDVLVVRKEFAATNYFLPGYWPHAALVLGTTGDLRRLGVADHEHVRSRLQLLQDAWTAGGASEDPSAAQPCVLESMKDGVRVRSIDSPLSSDSIIVLRPRLEAPQVACALAQALMHEGKPYDFDFDFAYSHRMVCTEVVYRAYDGVGDVTFDLQRHVGRFALAAGDLLRMALAERHFAVVAAYVPADAPTLARGAAAAEIVRRREGAA